MITLWLPSLTGEVRLYKDTETGASQPSGCSWQSYPSFEALNAALNDEQAAAPTSGAKRAKRSKGKASTVRVYFPTLLLAQVKETIERAQYQKLGSAGVAYLLENHVLGSVDKLSVKSTPADNSAYISALELSVIEQIQNSLALIGLQLEMLLPDFLLLPVPSRHDHAFVYHDEQTTVMRISEQQGVAVDDMALTLSKLGNITQIQVLGDAQQLQTELIDCPVLVNSANLDMLKPSAVTRHWLDMLPQQASAQLSPYWRAVAAVAVLALFSILVFDGLRIYHYKTLEKSYQAQTYKQFSHWFSGQRPPADIRREIESMTQRSEQTQGSLFELLSSVSPLLKQSGFEAKRVAYSGDSLDISLSASNINELQTLVKKMQAQGIKANLGNVATVESSVEGVVSISA